MPKKIKNRLGTCVFCSAFGLGDTCAKCEQRELTWWEQRKLNLVLTAEAKRYLEKGEPFIAQIMEEARVYSGKAPSKKAWSRQRVRKLLRLCLATLKLFIHRIMVK